MNLKSEQTRGAHDSALIEYSSHSMLFGALALVVTTTCGTIIDVTLRTQSLARTGTRRWLVNEQLTSWNASETGIVIVDTWTAHQCPSVVERVKPLAVQINRTVTAARQRGIMIIHAPSHCIAHYTGHPAREYVLRLLAANTSGPMPPLLNYTAPPEPLTISPPQNGCDTNDNAPASVNGGAQDPSIFIDPKHDAIIDDGSHNHTGNSDNGGIQLWAVVSAKKLKNIVYVGIAENMCVMHRDFGIEKTRRWGLNPVLVRDLTDSMYQPTDSPYVSHEEGTKIMGGYIEKFWAPSVSKWDILCARDAKGPPGHGCVVA